MLIRMLWISLERTLTQASTATSVGVEVGCRRHSDSVFRTVVGHIYSASAFILVPEA